MTEGSLELYRELGELEGCRRLSQAFYARVAEDPVLRPVFPGSFHCAIEAFALYLSQFLGGPCEYSRQRWWLSLRESHLRFRIGPRERDAWMGNMRKALEDVQASGRVAGALIGFFEQSAAHVVNRGEMAEGAAGEVHPALRDGWDEQLAVDEAVAAVKAGDGRRAAELAESPRLRACFERDPAALVSLLALMMAGGDGAMVEYAGGKLASDPSLARATYTHGRTLLHAAAAAGSLPMVELLLRLGADAEARDDGGHTALYCVGNECARGGADVVRALVGAGANVDANGGVKRCTPLHMAARRGNVEVAEALLDCGAALEARDSQGVTPLRRAVNCRKRALAEFLVSRGARAEVGG